MAAVKDHYQAIKIYYMGYYCYYQHADDVSLKDKLVLRCYHELTSKLPAVITSNTSFMAFIKKRSVNASSAISNLCTDMLNFVDMIDDMNEHAIVKLLWKVMKTVRQLDENIKDDMINNDDIQKCLENMLTYTSITPCIHTPNSIDNVKNVDTKETELAVVISRTVSMSSLSSASLLEASPQQENDRSETNVNGKKETTLSEYGEILRSMSEIDTTGITKSKASKANILQDSIRNIDVVANVTAHPMTQAVAKVGIRDHEISNATTTNQLVLIFIHQAVLLAWEEATLKDIARAIAESEMSFPSAGRINKYLSLVKRITKCRYYTSFHSMMASESLKNVKVIHLYFQAKYDAYTIEKLVALRESYGGKRIVILLNLLSQRDDKLQYYRDGRI